MNNKKDIKSTVYVTIMVIICFMLITSVIRLCIISFGDWYDKGKYFTCQTHTKLFMHAPDNMKFEEIEIVKGKSSPDNVSIVFEEFTIKSEANSYITSWIFGIPMGLNSDQVTINDGKMLLVIDKDVEFEFPYTEVVDKKQKERLVNNYKDAIDWACETETRIIIARFILLVGLMFVVVKKYRKLRKSKVAA